MSENMSISVNGQSQVPPGFRFHPTEEELLQYYLKKKVSNQNIDLNVIREVDLNKLEPWDIQEMCKIGTTPQNDWYFFSHKDKKYPTGTRTNRATGVGFWKATGRDKIIYSNGRRIGMRKTLVFYKGRAPRGLKSDWIMHEYRILDDNTKDDATNHVSIVLIGSNGDVVSQEEGWVVCRIFMKKNHYKTLENSEGANLDQILGEIADNINESIKLQKPNIINTDTKSSGFQESFSKLPNLESLNSTSNWKNCYQPSYHLETKELEEKVISDDYNTEMENSVVNVMMTNWAAMDRLVASQLNCQSEALNISDPTNCINMNGNDQELQIHQNLRSISSSSSFSNISNKSYSATQNYYNQIDLWSLAQSSSSLSSNLSYSYPLCHVSNSRI